VAASLSERDTSSDSLEFFGVNWKQVGVAVLAGVAVSVSTQVVLDKLGYRHGSSRSS
jgi:opacity protein-like surface antigen